ASDEASPSASHSLRVAAAMGGLLSWDQPHLVFKYLRLHPQDEASLTEAEENHGCVGSLARLWLSSMLGLGSSSLHELRCEQGPNRAGFDAICAASPAGRRAVRLWVRADARECIGHGNGGEGQGWEGGGEEEKEEKEGAGGRRESEAGSYGGLAGVCDAQSLFMAGEEMKSCMRIDPQCVRENRGLLGYLLQVGCELTSRVVWMRAPIRVRVYFD
ncbi:MAG: hypothetical protein SGPRY_014661, partial [Prymnesium sp.]